VPRYLGVDPGRVVVLPNGVDLDEIAALTPPDPRAVAEAALPALRGADPVLPLRRPPRELQGIRRRGGGPGCAAGGRTAGPELGLGHRRRRPRGGAPAPPARARDGAARTFAGRVPDSLLHALYERADLFVHPTHYEGSSLVTLEAMAHGRAVVATRAGGIPDKVQDGITGLLVEPGAPAGLASALGGLAQDRPAPRGHGWRRPPARARSVRWNVLIDRTLALYEDLCRQARA
jgi:hypothetical protein